MIFLIFGRVILLPCLRHARVSGSKRNAHAPVGSCSAPSSARRSIFEPRQIRLWRLQAELPYDVVGGAQLGTNAAMRLPTPSPHQAPKQRRRSVRRIDDYQRLEQFRMRNCHPLRDRAAHRMPDQHHARPEALDQAADVLQIRRRTVISRTSPLAASVTSKVKREHAPIRRQHGCDAVPPMRMRRAAMEENESALVGIAAPVQIVKLESLNLDVPMGRLREHGSRLLLCHNRQYYSTRNREHRFSYDAAPC